MSQMNSQKSWASVCALEDLYPNSGACVLVGAILSDVAVAILDPRVRLS